MAAGLQITRLLLSCLLSEVCYSVAFPRGRSFAPSNSEQPLEKHSFFHRHPKYSGAPWQQHEAMQSKPHDQSQGPNWQKPQAHPWRLGNHGLQIQNKAGRYQTWMPHYARSHLHTNHPPAKPKSFEFNMKIPFLNFGQYTETHKPTQVSSGAGDHSHLYKPSSMEIQSSFQNPSSTGDIPNKGAHIPYGKKDPHYVPKPSFNFSFSLPLLPIPSIGHFPKQTKNDSGKAEPIKIPGLLGIKPLIQQGSISSGHQSTVQSQDVRKPVVPKPSYWPVQSFSGPQTVSGSNTGQRNPTNPYANVQTWPLQSPGSTDAFDRVHSPPASVFHHHDPFKPSTSYYGGLETDKPGGSQPVISSETYHRPHVHLSSSHGRNSEAVRPGSESHHTPSSTRSLYELLTSGGHNTAFYDGRSSGVPSGSSGSSFWDHANTETNGHGAAHHYRAPSRQHPNPQNLNIRYPHIQDNVKPHYNKLFINVEDQTSNSNSHSHKDDGFHKYVLPQGPHHGYPMGLAGHDVDRMYTGNPDPLPFPVLKPPLAATSWLHHRHQPSGYGFKQISTEYLKPLQYTPYQNIRPSVFGPGHKYPFYKEPIVGYKPQTHPDEDHSYTRYVRPTYYN